MGSFLERVHFDFETLLIFVTYFQECFMFQIKFSEHHRLLELLPDDGSLDQQGLIGGQGKMVVLNESKFGRCKYNVSRVING